MLQLTGRRVTDYQHEAGGHRWQRIPPNEKRGRVHTSTVTVAIIEPTPSTDHALNLADVEISTTKNSGPGGQHRNKTESAVIAVHRPTGERVRIATTRSQHENKALALSILGAKVSGQAQAQDTARLNANRKQQVGSGERGDKVRTYREQDDRVTDHRTGQTWRLGQWRKGIW